MTVATRVDACHRLFCLPFFVCPDEIYFVTPGQNIPDLVWNNNFKFYDIRSDSINIKAKTTCYTQSLQIATVRILSVFVNVIRMYGNQFDITNFKT